MVAWDLCKVFATVRFCYPPPYKGRVAEWPMASVLKTEVSKGTVSSNLTSSANNKRELLCHAKKHLKKHTVTSLKSYLVPLTGIGSHQSEALSFIT